MTQEELNAAKKKYGLNFIGNVIRIIDEYTIIVNTGKVNLSVGDIIHIYEPGEVLKDLDGNNLCAFDFVKDELEVIRVESLYSVCQKNKTVTKTYNFPLSPLLEHTETNYIPLKIDKNDIQELKPQDRLVRVGDPIKLA